MIVWQIVKVTPNPQEYRDIATSNDGYEANLVTEDADKPEPYGRLKPYLSTFNCLMLSSNFTW